MSELEVIKNNGALCCSGQLSRLEQVLFNSVLAIVYDDLLTKQIHHIPLAQLLDKAKCGNKAKQIKHAFARIQDTKLEYNILDKAGKTEAWGRGNLISWVDYKDGVLSIEFSSTMAKLLRKPKIYTKINLLLSASLKCKYTTKFYELCLMWLGTGRSKGSSGFVVVADMRKLLDAGTTYPTTANFFQKTIKKAIDEIHAHPQLRIHIEVKKTLNNRKVVGWKFIIRKKDPSVIDVQVKKSFTDLADDMRDEDRNNYIEQRDQAVAWFSTLDASRTIAIINHFKKANALVLFGEEMSPGGEPDFTNQTVMTYWSEFLIEHYKNEIYGGE